jgi:hypothetical protein
MPLRSIDPNDTGPETDPDEWPLASSIAVAPSLPTSPQPAKQSAPKISLNFTVDLACLIIALSLSLTCAWMLGSWNPDSSRLGACNTAQTKSATDDLFICPECCQ